MTSFDIIRELLHDELDIDPESVTGTSTFDSLHIDSLDMVQLICAVEDKCDIDFGEPEGLTTVDELAAYLDELRA